MAKKAKKEIKTYRARGYVQATCFALDILQDSDPRFGDAFCSYDGKADQFTWGPRDNEVTIYRHPTKRLYLVSNDPKLSWDKAVAKLNEKVVI